jgi:hypothetical protein
MLEGPHSDRVQDTIDLLLSRDLRLGLHRWYRRPNSSLDANAIRFRDLLSQLAGEKLEA